MVADRSKHPDERIDRLLGAVVANGGELDTSDEVFIWVYCRCGNATHSTAVRRTYQDPGYPNRKIEQIREFRCLWTEGGEPR